MRKILAALFALLSVAAAGGYYYFSGREYVFRFSESELREKLNEKLPYTRSYLIFEVGLDKPRISLADGSGRVAAGLDMVLNMHVGGEPKPLGGTIDVTSGVRYVPAKGQFFLTDPVIERLAVQGIPEKQLQKANAAVAKAVAAYFSEYPIYTLKATDVKQAAARLVLKSVVVEDHVLIVTVGI